MKQHNRIWSKSVILKVSMDAVGYYLAKLIGLYNAENGTPPVDATKYESGVPNLLSALRRWEDAPYIRAALDQLLDRDSLTPSRLKYLNRRGVMDIDVDELQRILVYMRKQIDQHFHPRVPYDIEVQFVSTGDSFIEWIFQREILNPRLGWSSIIVVPEGNPCPHAGIWWTPTNAKSERYFQIGEVMPSIAGKRQPTRWLWEAANQP